MGKAQRLIYIKLPAEDVQKHGKGKLGRLVKSMYGTQDASHLWQLDYVELCCESELGGFMRGKHNAALFWNHEVDIRMAVHGDDFIVVSDDKGLEHTDRMLKSRYPVKVMGTLGFDESDDDHLQLLNRILRRGRDDRGEFIDLEPDPRHAKLITSEVGFNEKSKAVTTPREKMKDELVVQGSKSKKLIGAEATRYRSACMRLSYLAQDRLDLVESAKCAAQRMASPTEFDWQPLKRVARYLLGRPRAAIRFRWQPEVKQINVYVDSDYAGDPISRKSTTGLVVMAGTHMLKCSSTLQSLTALSVGEAEFYAVVKGGAVGLSLKAIYEDLGKRVDVEIDSDSTTAGSLADRLGVGQRTKHIQTRFLWVQERVQDRDLRVKKVHTSKNVADVATKPVSGQALNRHCEVAHLVFAIV
jgi:ribonuclease HI